MLSSSSLNCTACTNKNYKLLSAPSVQPTASLARLRGAGVPVLGMWEYKGVAHGKLMCYDGYTCIPELQGDNLQDLTEKLDIYLNNLIAQLNTTVVECDCCKGTGHLITTFKH